MLLIVSHADNFLKIILFYSGNSRAILSLKKNEMYKYLY